MEASLVHYVQQRLTERRMTYECFLEELEIPGCDELRNLVEAMTVVYTWFFRDPGQFRVIEELIRDFASERAMSIWVAGCATGEEPYSVALVAAALGKRVEILGTDLNTAALNHARAGRYATASLNAVDVAMRERYLSEIAGGEFVIPDAIRKSVRFQSGNLVDAAPRAPTGQGWDLIICRNVLIYFSQEQARRTLEIFANSLAPERHLVLGASEAILERPVGLTVVDVAGRAILERPRSGQSGAMLRPPSGDKPSAPALRVAQPSEPRIQARPTKLAVSQSTSRGGATTANVTRACHPTLIGSVELPQTSIDALRKGCAALDAGDVLAAKELCSLAVRLDPTCAESAMFAGIAHYLDGNFEEALRLLRSALCLDAKLWPACFYQALCYDNLGYADDAARSYALVTKFADASGSSTHHFLAHWRSDLLDVARKRSRSYVESRKHGAQRLTSPDENTRAAKRSLRTP
jgi:chemotaxis protein methyltransferase CheR